MESCPTKLITTASHTSISIDKAAVTCDFNYETTSVFINSDNSTTGSTTAEVVSDSKSPVSDTRHVVISTIKNDAVVQAVPTEEEFVIVDDIDNTSSEKTFICIYYYFSFITMGRGSGMVMTFLFVCVSVHALKGKWLELSTPKLVDI